MSRRDIRSAVGFTAGDLVRQAKNRDKEILKLLDSLAEPEIQTATLSGTGLADGQRVTITTDMGSKSSLPLFKGVWLIHVDAELSDTDTGSGLIVGLGLYAGDTLISRRQARRGATSGIVPISRTAVYRARTDVDLTCRYIQSGGSSGATGALAEADLFAVEISR